MRRLVAIPVTVIALLVGIAVGYMLKAPAPPPRAVIAAHRDHEHEAKEQPLDLWGAPLAGIVADTRQSAFRPTRDASLGGDGPPRGDADPT